jgi:hypothetical protein
LFKAEYEQLPKSASLQIPSLDKRMFAPLMSLDKTKEKKKQFK